jgi:hypothetical protein
MHLVRGVQSWAAEQDQGRVRGKRRVGSHLWLCWTACPLGRRCTDAGASGFLKDLGLPTDPRGFLLINACLQSSGGPAEVFAAGEGGGLPTNQSPYHW